MKTKGSGLVEGILQAAEEAGRELVKEGKISEELQRQVSRELMPKDAYYEAAKESMKK